MAMVRAFWKQSTEADALDESAGLTVVFTAISLFWYPHRHRWGLGENKTAGIE